MSDERIEQELDKFSIFELMNRVRGHPDFLLGVLFTRDDIPEGTVLQEDFQPKHIEDVLVQNANEILYDHVRELSDAERASLLPGEAVPDPRRVAELEATREDEVAASDFPTGPEDAEARERARVRREGRRHD